MNSIITGTGSYIPDVIKKNADFLDNSFYSDTNDPLTDENDVIIQKFKGITGIEERRYLPAGLLNSEIATIAANLAIERAGIDIETIDQIIFAHNFGDLNNLNRQSDMLPSLASKTKHLLRIKNPDCVAYDIIFGCPGWLQGIIQADQFIKTGLSKRCLVIGSETLSRIIDPHDRDSMIYADGAGACILEKGHDSNKGILSYASQTFTFEESNYIFFGESNKTDEEVHTRYLKMHGRKIYEFALNNVPLAMKQALDKSGVPIDKIKKILIHQANEKMDEAIIKRFYRLFKTKVPDGIMPMSINILGNSSVATIPTLLDLILNGNFNEHHIAEGDAIMFASVGAGMNINAVVYQY
ncbi:3-oxoacyl-ACP synthase III family protein [Lutimonas vermicola]|uniref:3-oxoacyl-ACP synthase III family protein n=1 Tax=Lutimonas vermicola TaxID=414288 RepID=A0ABU9KZ30_9FLAO